MSAADQFVVSHGKSGALGVFRCDEPLTLRRGARVLVRTPRGTEVGAVLCPATIRQARLLGATASGELLRPLAADDETRLTEMEQVAGAVFTAARTVIERDRLGVEILDVDVLFDGAQAVVQYVGATVELDAFAHALEERFQLAIRLENLAAAHADEPEEHGGCDKPDCGRNAGGGCSTCSTGGGCSSCGSGKVDMREYFGHLRTQMESKPGRVPLA